MNLQYANYLLNTQEKDFKGEKSHKQSTSSARPPGLWCAGAAVGAAPRLPAMPWGTLWPSWPCRAGESGVALCGAAVPSAWHRAPPLWRVCGPQGISAEDAPSAVAVGAGRPLLPCPVSLAGGFGALAASPPAPLHAGEMSHGC